MGARVLRGTALCALLLAGLAVASVAAAGRGPAASSTTSPTATTTVPTTTSATPTAPPATVPTTTSAAPEVLVFSGHGWGHGLGMSQWGAAGYARHGWTYDRILAHYYRGTTLGRATTPTVRVLLVSARRATLSSPVAWTVTDATGKTATLQAGDVPLGPVLSVAGSSLQPPLTFSGPQPLLVDGHAYRGRIVVSATAKQVQVVDSVSLESYVKGVVPAEMPSSWPAEALEAQAVASRSYALANLQRTGSFDLYGDGRSQVYGGVAAETPAASAAVDATRGQVVLYGGKVADTLFFSTSGGRTASAADETGRAVPYLVSVPDPYDDASPYHDWGPLLVDAGQVQQLLNLPGPVQAIDPGLGGDGRVVKAVVVGPYGTQVTVTGDQLRVDLGLPSTWFQVGVLALTPSASTATWGGAVTLNGRASGVGPVTLEARAGSGPWLAVPAALAPAADGSFSTIVRPQATTQYRLVAATVRAGFAKVAVAPAVQATVAAGSATGGIRPALPGAPVQLQFSSDGVSWHTVGTATTDASGAFSVAAGDPATGSYRVRVAPGHGLVAGYSKPASCC